MLDFYLPKLPHACASAQLRLMPAAKATKAMKASKVMKKPAAVKAAMKASQDFPFIGTKKGTPLEEAQKESFFRYYALQSSYNDMKVANHEMMTNKHPDTGLVDRQYLKLFEKACDVVEYNKEKLENAMHLVADLNLRQK